MAVIKLMTKRERILFSILFLFFSMLMIGASKVTGRLSQVGNKKKVENTQMTSFVNSIKKDIDVENVKTWDEVAKINPQFIFKANAIRFH